MSNPSHKAMHVAYEEVHFTLGSARALIWTVSENLHLHLQNARVLQRKYQLSRIHLVMCWKIVIVISRLFLIVVYFIQTI